MIQFSNVTKIYDNGVVALSDVTFRINTGEFVYLIGPSGSGKSTLMKLIYREEYPSDGEIIVDKINLAQLKPKKTPYYRRKLGVVFQDFKLIDRLTVGENIAFAMEITGESRKKIKERVKTVLSQVGLLHKIDQYPSQLSGGEEQRVGIARAIVNHPAILIADEPTGNLDPENSLEILQILEEINRMGTTVLMGTHDLDMVRDHPHRILQMEKGQLIEGSKVRGAK